MGERRSQELSINEEIDIVKVRRAVRDVVLAMGFGTTDVTRVVTAASELARNVFAYAGQGLMRWKKLTNRDKVGIELIFIDHGPGIEDVETVMQHGFSSSGGLGMGLPGAERLMGELEIKSRLGQGTTVTVRKWQRSN